MSKSVKASKKASLSTPSGPPGNVDLPPPPPPSTTPKKVKKSGATPPPPPLSINNNLSKALQGLSEEELKELKTAFYLIDKNHDGRLTVSEFQIMLQNFGIHVPDKLVLHLIKQASATGAGILNEAEFLEWISTFLSEIVDDVSEDLLAAFRVFDKDNNGFITKDELKESMEMIGEALSDQELEELLVMADVDKDGRIDYEEFARLLS